jgi:hypothetical protein
MQGANYKIHDALDESSPDYDPECASVWENAEVFDPKTERLFRYLQAGSHSLFQVRTRPSSDLWERNWVSPEGIDPEARRKGFLSSRVPHSFAPVKRPFNGSVGSNVIAMRLKLPASQWFNPLAGF